MKYTASYYYGYSFRKDLKYLTLNPYRYMEKMLSGSLTSFSDTVKANVNGTMFRSCIVNIGGTEYFAKIWEKSVSKATVGNTYNVEAIVDGDKLWLTVLTGTSATVATPAMFADVLESL
jgi:hypothetical protein